MLISSVDNLKVKEWQKLNIKKYRDETGLFLVEGKNLVLEAYKVGCIKELILAENETLDLDVNTIYVTDKIVNKISSLETPSSIMAICTKKESNELGNRLLILDGIQDPGNLGTIIRSCVAFNIDTIILSDNTVDVYNSKTVRASQGMLFHLNIIRTNLLSFIPTIKTNGYEILGTTVINGKDIVEAKVSEKYALIMGNEGNGLSQEVINLCDKLLTIKINNSCESLNVAVACSIILYQLNK